MKFSVIISVYPKDMPSWFAEAFESIVEQHAKPSQIVIAQDGRLIGDLKDTKNYLYNKYCDYFSLDEVVSDLNVGRGEMLRRSILICNHNLIAIMDADDVSHPDRFKKQLTVLRDSKLDLVGSWVNEAEPHSLKIYAIKQVPEDSASILAYSKFRNPINQMTVMFRKEAVLLSGNYEACANFEDYWLWCRMLHNGFNLYNLQESLVTARAGAGMHKRRIGFEYAKSEALLFSKLRTLGYYTWLQYFRAMAIRLPMRLLHHKVYGYLLSAKRARNSSML